MTRLRLSFGWLVVVGGLACCAPEQGPDEAESDLGSPGSTCAPGCIWSAQCVGRPHAAQDRSARGTPLVCVKPGSCASVCQPTATPATNRCFLTQRHANTTNTGEGVAPEGTVLSGTDDALCYTCRGGAWDVSGRTPNTGGRCSPRAAACEHPVPLVVVSYDPVLTSVAGRPRLHAKMGWNDPRVIVDGMIASLKRATDNRVCYTIADWVDVDRFPTKRDGFVVTESQYLAAWSKKETTGSDADFHRPDTAGYASAFGDGSVSARLARANAHDVWFLAMPYGGFDELAMKTPGDQVYYNPDNPWFYRPYDMPDLGATTRVMGLSYERGVAEALHSYGHLVESFLSLVVGRGHWGDGRTSTNPWDRFTTFGFPGAACGNVHTPPNTTIGYDYANGSAVLSACDDWMGFPALTGALGSVSGSTWGTSDPQRAYLEWWLRHIPHAGGATGGVVNDWWAYVVDYDNVTRRSPPPGGRLQRATVGMF